MGTQNSFLVSRIFFYFSTELKIYHLYYSIYKHDAIDIADPSSMQDACHMNFVIEVAHRGVSEGLRFDSQWGLRIFFLRPMLVTRRKTSFSKPYLL